MQNANHTVSSWSYVFHFTDNHVQDSYPWYDRYEGIKVPLEQTHVSAYNTTVGNQKLSSVPQKK